MDKMLKCKKIFEAIMDEKCLEIKELKGGVTNHSYLIKSASHCYILRIPGNGTNEYINRKYEIENMKKTQKLGFIPHIFYCDSGSGILILNYIHNNEPMCIADIHNKAKLNLMTERLVQLHQSSIKLANEFNIMDSKKQYRNILDKMKVPLPCEFLNQVPRLENMTNYLFTKYSQNLVPCHGDPKLNNFLLQDDKMWLIDWEYSGMAEKYFDLVNMTSTDELNPSEEQLILSSYERNSGEYLDKRKYILYKIVIDYMWIYWHLIKFFQNEMPEYNNMRWQHRLNRIFANIKILEKIN
ncbi:hypothetical protein IMSAGC009_04126 [Lachnospiraceae bacterium]|nr:hypothetical protein IMSAGC009_04126 [Lachnospiraceae bacterium]